MKIRPRNGKRATAFALALLAPALTQAATYTNPVITSTAAAPKQFLRIQVTQ